MWICSAVSGSFGSAMERLHTAPAARVARGGAVPTDAALDAGKTAPFELPGERGACLLIHGFTGTPWDVRPLGEALSRAGIAVHGVRLPGHGTTPAAMLDARAPDWLLACDEALARLAGPAGGGGRAVDGRAARPGARGAAPDPGGRGGGAGAGGALPGPDAELAPRAARLAAPLLELLRPWVHKDTTDLLDAGGARPRPRCSGPGPRRASGTCGRCRTWPGARRRG